MVWEHLILDFSPSDNLLPVAERSRIPVAELVEVRWLSLSKPDVVFNHPFSIQILAKARPNDIALIYGLKPIPIEEFFFYPFVWEENWAIQ